MANDHEHPGYHSGPFAAGGEQIPPGGSPHQMPPPEYPPHMPHMPPPMAHMAGPWAGYYPHQHWGPPPVPPGHWHEHMAAYAQQSQQTQPPPQQSGPHKHDPLQAMLKDLGNSAGLGSLVEMLSLDDKEFWKGALVGAAIALLASNENVRGSLMGAMQTMMAAVNNVTGDNATKENPTDDSAASSKSSDNQEEGE